MDISNAQDAELVAALRARLEQAKGPRLAKLGTMLLNLGSDAVIAMYEGHVRAFFIEDNREE